MSFKILVVEDEFSINDILTFALKSEGYQVKSTYSARKAREAIEEYNPHLALLDINLPDESGFELCKFINSKYKVPILMLTARSDVIDRVLGLELGADDYITKPFHIKEVLTRVKVALRRVEKYSKFSGKDGFIELNREVQINLKSRRILKKGEDVKLKPKEYDLLAFLVQNKNRVFSRDKLIDRIWGVEYQGEMRTVDIHVRRLRSKLDLENGQSIIETVFGVGYVMR